VLKDFVLSLDSRIELRVVPVDLPIFSLGLGSLKMMPPGVYLKPTEDWKMIWASCSSDDVRSQLLSWR
jgi:hypothetical protein